MFSIEDEPRKHCTRQLDIVKHFVDHANNLLQAVDDGKLIHGTGNIAESGATFENTLRKIFTDSLPSSVAVWPGYFMDPELYVSNQQDLLFCNIRETLQLPPSKDMTQHYVLLSSVHVFGQMKTTASPKLLLNALTQNALAIAQSREMRPRMLGQRALPEEMSLLIFGRGGSIENVRKALQTLAARDDNQPKVQPTYILLIEKGVIFAPTHTFLGDMEPDFKSYKNRNTLTACVPKGPASEAAGRALMWIFFAIAAKLNFEGLTDARLTSMIDYVEREFGLSIVADHRRN
jgi:hypothetical protein